LDKELDRHEPTMQLSVLAMDFDGMREANSAFASYELGGDVLIRAVGEALRKVTRDGEFPARLYTAGDEFALLLPRYDEPAAGARATEIEAHLDALAVPETHRDVYRGASVGYATRQAGETPGQVLGRAVKAMRDRKLQRSRT